MRKSSLPQINKTTSCLKKKTTTFTEQFIFLQTPNGCGGRWAPSCVMCHALSIHKSKDGRRRLAGTTRRSSKRSKTATQKSPGTLWRSIFATLVRSEEHTTELQS